MGVFRYVAKGPGGHYEVSVIEAQSEHAVVADLRKRGLTILSVSEEAHHARDVKRSRGKAKKGELVVFSRQLATMVDAGLPIVQSINTLGEQAGRPGLRRVLQDIERRIEHGASFSEAIAGHPRVFSQLYISMVRAGEASGNLAEILDRLAAHLEASLALRRKVRSAMMYPIMVSIIGLIITSVLLLKVIPVFGGIYASFGSDLPVPTQMLLDLSYFLRAYFPFVVGALVVGFFLIRGYVKTESGSIRYDQFKLGLPIFGPLFRKVAISRFSRTLSVLVRSGVPILNALEIVSKTAGNKLVERAVTQAMIAIKQGDNIARPLASSKVFPPMVVKMISVGEDSGKLETMLAKISDFYDSENEAAINGLTSLIEPLLIAFLGVVVGTVVICMFLPIFRLSSIVQI
jgi:type IV pilus assembly protein PilC